VETWASPYLAAQAAYLRHVGTAPVAEVLEREGVYAVRTGVASNSENGVVSAGNAPVGADVAHDVIGWLNERKLPASWLCAEGQACAETTRNLEDAGCQLDRGSWEMRVGLNQLDLDAWQVPVDARIAPVASERDVEVWLDIAGECGWFETEAERRAWEELHLGLALRRSAPSRLYVAFCRERAVGMASAFYGKEIVLLTAVGVLAGERRKGIARSLVLTRLREARDRGCKVAVLAPSPDGAKLYQALRFETHPLPADRWFYLVPSRSGTCSAQQ
jgi:GNAT superfamily N-acetyltransferase